MKFFNSLIIALLLFSNLFFTYASASPSLGILKVHFIDLEQGEAIYIKTPAGDDILIDAGAKESGSKVVDYLKRMQVDDLEVLIATHPDSFHIGGMSEVLKAFQVETVFAPNVANTTQDYSDFLTAVKTKNLTIQTAKNGVILPLKDKMLKARFIGPVKDYDKTDLNDWSAVLHINYGKNNFLFTGDAELDSEKDMLNKKLIRNVNVLKVSNDGSKDSSSAPFLKMAKPTYSILCVSSKYPSLETLNKLEAMRSTVYRTDQNGSIIATSNGTKVTIETEKPVRPLIHNKQDLANFVRQMTGAVVTVKNDNIYVTLHGKSIGTYDFKRRNFYLTGIGTDIEGAGNFVSAVTGIRSVDAQKGILTIIHRDTRDTMIGYVNFSDHSPQEKVSSFMAHW